jgi:hypothetical protein
MMDERYTHDRLKLKREKDFFGPIFRIILVKRSVFPDKQHWRPALFILASDFVFRDASVKRIKRSRWTIERIASPPASQSRERDNLRAIERPLENRMYRKSFAVGHAE